MVFKAYKILFNFFNLICILSINFNGKIFSAPKLLQIKSIIVVFSVLILKGTLKFYEKNQNVEALKAGVKNVSLFFLLFSITARYLILLLPFISTIILLRKQKVLAKIFTIFYELKRFCETENIKIESKKLSKKIFKSLIVFSIISILEFDYIKLFYLKKRIDLIDILVSIIDHTIKCYYLFLLNFWNIILIYYEFLLLSANKILENQFKITHENCEIFLQKLNIIKKLITFLNESFGKLFSIQAVSELLGSILFVRILC